MNMITKALKVVPVPLQICFIRIVLNFFNHRRFQAEERLDSLDGTIIQIRLLDISIDYYFKIDKRMVSCHGKVLQDAAVKLVGETSDMINLLLKKEDSDSLFFSRKITIEGNVEKSVLFKNIIANL